jgi:hypothetical protein
MSPRSAGTPAHGSYLASSGTSISRLRILPVGPLGSSSTNQILRGESVGRLYANLVARMILP